MKKYYMIHINSSNNKRGFTRVFESMKDVTNSKDIIDIGYKKGIFGASRIPYINHASQITKDEYNYFCMLYKNKEVSDIDIEREADLIVENEKMAYDISLQKIVKYVDDKGNFITVSENPETFMSQDFKYSHPDIPFVEIFDIYVFPEDRRKGIGSKLLKKVIDEYNEKAILVAIGASKLEYKEEPSDDELIIITEKIKPFYENNGFIDVNSYYGGYEFKCAYLYLNELGKKVLENIKNEENE